MTITAENIEQLNQIGQQSSDFVSTLLRQSIAVSPSENKKSIAHKIDVLTLIRELLVQTIDIETLPTDKDELAFMDLITNITEQIQYFEIAIGRKKIENLRRAGQNLAKKQRYSMGIVD